LLVKFRYRASDRERLEELEENLRAALESASVGAYDGNELAVDAIGMSTLYMYGPDADGLFEVAAPNLKASSLMTGATAIKRYGPPSATAKQTAVQVDEQKMP
jgi:hypothetical protein